MAIDKQFQNLSSDNRAAILQALTNKKTACSIAQTLDRNVSTAWLTDTGLSMNSRTLRNCVTTGKVMWITGLSGAGKSTLAKSVAARLRTTGQAVVLLDGDELRDVFGAVAPNVDNYSRERRLGLAMHYSRLCRVISAQGLTVVIATISMFREVHAWNRTNLPGYYEVYLKVPVDELRRRDPKGIYSRFDAGELTQVAGMDLPIDEPEAADWTVEFESERTVAHLAEDLLSKLKLS